MTDRLLLERFADRRDESAELAFATLVGRHGPMVLGVCRGVLGDPHAAEDAFQATFIVLARKAGSLRRPESLGHWLLGVALRTARKARFQRERRRRHERQDVGTAVDEPVGDAGLFELRLVRREEAEALHEEVGRLPEKYRGPVVLCYLEGLTHAEAAERLRWPVGTLSVRLMRARALLRARLTRRGLAPAAGLLAQGALPETASADLPVALAESTVRAALRFSAGPVLTAGVAPTAVAALAEEVVGAMLLGPLVPMLAVAFLATGLAATCASALVRGAAEIEGRETSAGSQAQGIAAPSESPPRTNGDVERESPRMNPAGGQAGPDRGTVPDTDPALPSPARLEDDLEEYGRLASRAARAPEVQTALALWCEARGLFAERDKHLALAVLADPDYTPARSLLGQVAYGGRWRRPEEVDDQVLADTRLSAALAEYNARRGRMEETPDAHWKLALWCEHQGLKAEALAHVTTVTRLAPDRAAAWRRLGCKEYHGRWLRPEQIAAERTEAEAQGHADRRWRPLLAKWKAALRDESRRAWAEAKLDEVTEARAVPAVWATFTRGGADEQAVAARLFGQIGGPASARALALLAASGASPEVRRAATETLARRDNVDEAVGLLIGLWRDPVKYEVRPALGPDRPGVLLVEGETFNVRRLYAVPPPPPDTLLRLMDPTLPPNGSRLAEMTARYGADAARTMAGASLPRLIQQNGDLVQTNLTEVARATLAAQRQLADDINEIESFNRPIRELNRRLESILNAITGQDLGQDGEPWRRWWADRRGYIYEVTTPASKPTIDQEVTLAYSPNYLWNLRECFAAGTPVWTREGTRPIESIRVGDVVLTQDTTTGALAFGPVLNVAHNKPTPTLRVELGGDAIVTTGIHRFWKAHQGWVMARDLKPGDAVRVLGGLAAVARVSADRTQPVFNLEVGEGRSFFVGKRGELVHDDSPVLPVSRPFDTVPGPAAGGIHASAGDSGATPSP